VFDCRFDEVPLIDEDQAVILKYAFFMFMLYFWHISILQIHVIVFVMLAIYRFVLDRNPFIERHLPNWVVGVTNNQLLAVS
jgi:hypothetical protein